MTFEIRISPRFDKFAAALACLCVIGADARAASPAEGGAFVPRQNCLCVTGGWSRSAFVTGRDALVPVSAPDDGDSGDDRGVVLGPPIAGHLKLRLQFNQVPEEFGSDENANQAAAGVALTTYGGAVLTALASIKKAEGQEDEVDYRLAWRWWP